MKLDSDNSRINLWSRQKDSGKSISDLFSEGGVFLSKISPDRIQGWLCLKEWLKPYEQDDGTKSARMKIFENCKNLIRTLPQLLYDNHRTGDASTTPHEITHAPDALRYFACARTFSKKTKPKEKNNQKLKEKLKQQNVKML